MKMMANEKIINLSEKVVKVCKGKEKQEDLQTLSKEVQCSALTW